MTDRELTEHLSSICGFCREMLAQAYHDGRAGQNQDYYRYLSQYPQKDWLLAMGTPKGLRLMRRVGELSLQAWENGKK